MKKAVLTTRGILAVALMNSQDEAVARLKRTDVKADRGTIKQLKYRLKNLENALNLYDELHEISSSDDQTIKIVRVSKTDP